LIQLRNKIVKTKQIYRLAQTAQKADGNSSFTIGFKKMRLVCCFAARFVAGGY